MIVFWLICAGLVAISLAFILPPLLERAPKETGADDKKAANLEVYRDQLSELEADLRNGIISQEQFDQDRDEIERRLLEDVSSDAPPKKQSTQTGNRSLGYAVALAIPVIAVAFYLLVGNTAAISGVVKTATPAPFAKGAKGSQQMSQQEIEANVSKLQKRMEENPGDAEGWVMLGRSYMTLEKYSDASKAYARATAVKPDDADLLADYAFVMAMANGRQLQGEPYDLVKRALRIDPDNAKALDLAASAEFQAKNYDKAIDYWQKLLKKTPTDSELAGKLAQNILEAKTLAGASAK
jgi:cytochrome c-type biogenesis protein CcmH